MLVGLVTHGNMSTSLCFDGLRSCRRHKFSAINPFQDEASLIQRISEVDVLVTVRHLYSYPPVWQKAFNLGIPQYYLTDDNFPLLQKTDPSYSSYEEKQHRNNLRLFNGVLAATENLALYYKQRMLHGNIEFFGIVRDQDRDPVTLSQRNGNALHIGCFGGGFRSKSVKESVIPALAQLSKKLPIRFFGREDLEPFRAHFEKANIQLTTSKTVDDVNSFYSTWVGYDLDVMVHPSGDTDNLPYKNANALLNSYYLGANPIVTDEPAYENLGLNEGVTKVDGTPENYLAVLENFISSRYRHKMFTRLEVFAKAAFDSKHNISVLDKIQRDLEIPTAAAD